MRIPKIIHYCWFGNNEYPIEVKKSIASWKIHFGEYQLVKWDETNADMTTPFVKKAYDKKIWAFVSDYVRLKVLYEFGGIYLDTDMFAVKGLNDLLDQPCFFGSESPSRISCGIIAVEKQHPLIKKALTFYDDVQIPPHYDLWRIAIPTVVTNTFKEMYGYEGDFEDKVVVEGITIYPKSYFYPLPNDMHVDQTISKYIEPETYMVHLWSKSWKQVTEFTLIKRTQYFLAFKEIIRIVWKHKIISLDYYKKIVRVYKQSRKKKRNC